MSFINPGTSLDALIDAIDSIGGSVNCVENVQELRLDANLVQHYTCLSEAPLAPGVYRRFTVGVFLPATTD